MITYNNFENNNYNYYVAGEGFNVNVPQNWWGTTNETIISQTIHENKNDFDLGTVTFIPFLTTPNTVAPAIPTPSPTPTPNTSSSPLQHPTAIPTGQSDSGATQPFNLVEIGILAALAVVVVLLAVILVRIRKNRGSKNPAITQP